MTDKPLEKTGIDLDELLLLDGQVEIIDEEIVGMAAAGFSHHMFAGNIYDVVKVHVLANNLGLVLFDGMSYLMFSDANRLKDSFMPDVSFIRRENFIANFDFSKPYPGIPDLAVEVVSPGDDADKVQTKIRTYLRKGTEQVWIVYPTTREVHQYRRDNDPEIRIYVGSAQLDTESLFPGLELTTDMIFKLPDWTISQ